MKEILFILYKKKANFFASEHDTNKFMKINKDFADKNNLNTITSFMSLGLSRPILKALTELNFVQPTSVQSVCIPPALFGRDICAGAVTGSGKTGKFTRT